MMTRRSALAAFASLLSKPAFGADVPRPAKEFTIQKLEGGQVLVSQFKGKIILLEFLFST